MIELVKYLPPSILTKMSVEDGVGHTCWILILFFHVHNDNNNNNTIFDL